MLKREELKGIIVIMPTAFKDDGSFDEENYRNNVSKICESQVNGIMNLGTTGEFSNISFEEYKRIVDVLIDEVSGRLKVFVGASAVNTRAAIKRTKYAQYKGADAVINVVPFYSPLTQRESVKYFRDVANNIISISNNLIKYLTDMNSKR